MKLRALVFMCAVLGACAHRPTRVTETTARPYGVLESKLKNPVRVDEGTVVLDARGAFDYGLSHVNRAVAYGWERLAESRDSGEVLRDPSRAGERLALIGIRPETPVVVVGDGARGCGDDGRLAWTLLKLGVRDVQVVSHETLREYWAPPQTQATENAMPWRAVVKAELELDAAEIPKLAHSIEDLRAKRIWLIDVRTEKEYLAGPSLPGSVNVPWTEFYSAEGRPNAKVRRRLSGIDVRVDDRVVVMSPRGVRAGAAAYALMSLGYQKVQVARR